MYRIAVCDDDQITLSEFEHMLTSISKKAYLPMETELFNSCKDFIGELDRGKIYDIVILDIEFSNEEINGIDAANHLRRTLKNQLTQIIYISAKQHYATKLFRTRPQDFLTKPVSEQRLYDEIKEAIAYLEKSNDMFEYQFDKTRYRIPYGCILYFSSNARKIEVWTISDENPKVFYDKLDNVDRQVASHDFIRISKSIIVSFYLATSWQYESVTLPEPHAKRLLISRAYQPIVRDKIISLHFNEKRKTFA